MEPLLAKSNGTTLLEHTSHVVRAMERIAAEWLPESHRPVARRGAVLHDLGKAHPYFQANVRGIATFDPVKDKPHRHELSSLLLLPLFPSDEWGDLVDMVVGHHKSVVSHPNEPGSRRGLLDLDSEYGDRAFDRHAEQFDVWQGRAAPVLEAFGIAFRPVSLAEARTAWEFAVEHCGSDRKRLGWSEWRGVLMSADHLASALEEDTESRIESLFTRPDLTVFEDRANAADAVLYPLAKYSAHNPRPHTLVVAPTGSGKTDFLLRRCQSGRVFYLLPFQASINAMYLRLTDQLGAGCDVRRVHSASKIEIERDIEGEVAEETVLQKHPGAAVKVMTPHQIASLVVATSGHEATALDVRGQDVILDEIHVYSEQTQAMTLAIVETLVALGARVHLGSATIPTALEEEIIQRLGGMESVYSVRLSPDELQSYDRHVVHRLDNEDAEHKTVIEAIGRNQRVLFLSNRVATAQERYEWAKRTFGEEVPVLLLHSRFRRGDRADLEKQIAVYDAMQGPCLVCATQVVEVSLDISFDTLVTDCAPLDALVQRFGRVNRRRTTERLGSLAPVHVVAPPDSKNGAQPYALDELLRTWEQLPSGGVLHETELQSKIDAVYPEVDVTAISTHLAVDKGAFCYRELCHRSRSILIDMLEIDSVCVIRKSDEHAYRKGRNNARQLLEIPVPWKSLRAIYAGLEQLKGYGNDPFIMADTEYSETHGLWLNGDSITRPGSLVGSQFI